MLSEEHGHDPAGTRTKPLVFRINENGIGPEVVRDVLLDRGWEEFQEGDMEEYDWNLWWRTNRFRLCDYSDMMPWQRINHFPKATAITKKDTLARNMRRMRGVYGASVFNFSPLAFNLPNDYTKFVAEYSKLNQENGEGHQKAFWICKPADLSRGRGIFIFQDLSNLTYDCSAVVQRYITNPLLIGGYKFDLRIYVLVTSFNPLTIYMYKEGIARFSTDKFDLSSIGNMFSHLTNTSINKLGPGYTTFKEGVGPGCKWSLSMLRNYFHQQGIDDQVVWQRICNIITLTILAQAPTVPNTPGCIELFGFDILIDENLKPWLLEVNFSPALGLDCTVDHTIKTALIGDMLDLMQFRDEDGDRGGQQFAKLKQKQAYGTSRYNSPMSASKKPGPSKAARNRAINTSVGRTASRSSIVGGRRSVAKSISSGKLSGSEKMANSAGKMPPNQGGFSSYKPPKSKQSAEDLDDDYDEEIATVCERSSSESNIKGFAQEKLSGNPGSALSTKSGKPGSALSNKSGKPGSALGAMMLPSVEETRRQLDSRRELIQSRREQKQNVSSALLRKSSITSLRQSPSSHLPTSRSGMQRSSNSSSTRELSHRTTTQPSNQNSNASASGRVPSLSTDNSKSTTAGQDPHLKRTIKPALSKTGLLSRAKDGPLSFNKGKGNAATRMKNREQYPSAARTKAPKLPPQHVGDFVLTFPFNEATRRSSFPSLDIRTIIRETQKLLRRTMCQAHSTKQVTQETAYATTQRTGGVSARQQLDEVIVQWVPLKSQALVNGVI